MSRKELTEETFAEGMARAERVKCSSGNDRCSPFLDPVAEARASCTPKGRCRIGGTRGVIIVDSGCDSWDAWLPGRSDEGRLRHQVR